MPPASPPGFAAVLFDLDGTLYRQGPLRRRMLRELAASPLREGPARAYRTVRRLRVFRAAREELRALGRPAEPLVELQYSVPAERLGDEPAAVRATVEEWMFRRPLRHLPPCRRPGLAALLDELGRRSLRAGVFSDYPVAEKLDALGVRERFDVALCAVDRDVNAFKPHPRGFLAACERWGLAPERVLYVGDRDDVDGAGARAAGMKCVVLAGEATALDEVVRAL